MCALVISTTTKKVLVFVTSKGAGSTEPGKPYKAKFPDRFGNVCVCLVARPKVICLFFLYCALIDNWNQVWKFELAMEKKWVTQCGYFRLFTSFLGFTVADVYKVLPFVTGETPKNILELVDNMTMEMIEQSEGLESKKTATNKATSEVITCTTQEESSISSLTVALKSEHSQIWMKGGRQVRCVWCSRVNFAVRKTTLICKECNKGFCRDSSGKSCWLHHVALGGCPQAPEKGKIQENIKKRKEQEACDS